VNTASKLHCSLSEQCEWIALFIVLQVNSAISCTVHMNSVSMYIVHANCTVQWIVQLASTVREKARIPCFSFPAFGTQK
jgi:c-di-GMP-binding flagellar brake protein YcgR